MRNDFGHSFSSREQKLLAIIQSQPVSPSHDVDHLQQVIRFGKWLSGIYHAHAEVVVAAAILHDTARADAKFRGTVAAETAARSAQVWLEQSGYFPKEITKITQAIREHDDPKLHSDLLEARILKDADFLDGFGARGLVRSIMYALETSGGLSEALDRIQRKMSLRLQNLEFVESRRLGWQLHRLTEVFLSQLLTEPPLEQVMYPGKLIVLEGISASGKDTQAGLLKATLEAAGHQVEVLHHPTANLKQLWTEWQSAEPESMSYAFLTFADRFAVLKQQLFPALLAGKIIISSRSTWSAQAYQAQDPQTQAFYRFCASWEPVADALIYLKLDPARAGLRSQARAAAGQEDSPSLFGQTQTLQAAGYEATKAFYPSLKEVNADQPPELVHQEIVAALAELQIMI